MVIYQKICVLKENLGIVRVGLPHAKEEFLKDIRNGTYPIVYGKFLRSYFSMGSYESKKFKENNSDQSARYFFDPELGLVLW